MAFLEIIPKGKFGAQVRRSAVDLLKKNKLSALPDPSSLGKTLAAASPELGTKLSELDRVFKKMQVPPPQANLNWDSPKWEVIGKHFGLLEQNPTAEQLTETKKNILERHALKVARLTALLEAFHATADPAAAAQNFDKYIRNLPKEISSKERSELESFFKELTTNAASSTEDKASVLAKYENLKSKIQEMKTTKYSDEYVTKVAKDSNHPILPYLSSLKRSVQSIEARRAPIAQSVWDQTQVVFEALNLEWNLRKSFAADQVKHYEQELALVDIMQEELEDTQADHLLILKPQLVDEILAKFYEMQIGEEEQELHLPSGFDTLQEIEDAANVFLKEHKEFNDAEVLTSHLVEEETNAMLASGEHH